MGSSDHSLVRHKTVHQMLGSGVVADVVLWRQRNLTIGTLIFILSVWLVFERSGHTVLSLSSSVLLLLMTILFVWSRAAALLNRPAPPLPDLHLTQEMAAVPAELVRNCINTLISSSRDVALGKDARLYLKVAITLLLISVVGSLTDIVSLCYIGVVILFTIPVLYERNSDWIDKMFLFVYKSFHQVNVKLQEYVAMLRKLDLDKIQ